MIRHLTPRLEAWLIAAWTLLLASSLYANIGEIRGVSPEAAAVTARAGIDRAPIDAHSDVERHQVASMAWSHGAIWLVGLLGICSANRFARRRHQAEMASAVAGKEQAALQLVMDGVAESILMIDADYAIRMANPAARDFHGTDALIGNPCYRMIHGESAPCPETPMQPCPLRAAEREGKPVVVTHEHKRADGETRIVELLATPLHNDDGSFKGIIKVSRDVTARIQAERNLRHLAHHDALTRLPNRLRFEDALERLLEASLELTLMFIDLDRFKHINDTLGHSSGDQVLRIVAKRLRSAIGPEHFLARFGGDEFTVLLVGSLSQPEISLIARRILTDLDQAMVVDSYQFRVSASIGIATYPYDGKTVAGLMKSADTALHRAKSLGYGNFELFNRVGDQPALHRLQLEAALRASVAENALEVVFQPQVDATTGRLAGVEALARWSHPTFGAIAPTELIAIAEESGLIVEVGRQVLLKACRQAADWLAQGIETRVAVNVSPRQLLRVDLWRQVAEALEQTALPAHLLELEIVESAILQDVDAAAKVLGELRKLGVSIAIDDYGTGYSSLKYLKHFPVDALKIDQSFVNQLPRLRSDKAVVNTIISLAKNLDLLVIAEGVETPAQRDYLASQGCDLLQGFLFSEPVPPEQIAAIYK